jgi:hypothetical protein
MSAAQAITVIAISREDSAKMVDCGDCSTHGHIIVKKCLKRENPDTSGTGGAPMTTIQAVVFGVMLALTPSFVLLAFLLWREGIGLRSNSEFDGQRPYPKPH